MSVYVTALNWHTNVTLNQYRMWRFIWQQNQFQQLLSSPHPLQHKTLVLSITKSKCRLLYRQGFLLFNTHTDISIIFHTYLGWLANPMTQLSIYIDPIQIYSIFTQLQTWQKVKTLVLRSSPNSYTLTKYKTTSTYEYQLPCMKNYLYVWISTAMYDNYIM